MSPKISIIIPIFNMEKHLSECIESILNQTLNEIELICVNDGSTDKTLDLLNNYSEKDNRIIIINQHNQGVSKARNNGLKKANGEFVIFIDPDDLYPSTHILEKLYSKAVENNVLICGGQFSHFDQECVTVEYGQDMHGYTFENEAIIDYTNYQFDYGHTRFIYQRKFLIDNNITYPIYKSFEDPVFFVKAMILAKKFYAIQDISYAYRVNHKTINWDTIRTRDMLKGIHDNLSLSKKYNYQQLHLLTLNRLNCDWHASEVKKHLRKFNIEVIKQFLITKKAIDWKIVYQLDSDFKFNITIFNTYLQPLLQTLFSIKKTNNHKVLTILGINIKLYRHHA